MYQTFKILKYIDGNFFFSYQIAEKHIGLISFYGSGQLILWHLKLQYKMMLINYVGIMHFYVLYKCNIYTWQQEIKYQYKEMNHLKF